MSNFAKTNNPQTAERMAEVAHSAVDTAAAKAVELEKQVRSKVGNAAEKVSETKDATAERAQDYLSQVEKFARERPVAATGIAFAAGILAASLFGRK